MNDAVFGKKSPAENAETEVGSSEEAYTPPPAEPKLRNTFADEYSDEYNNFEEDDLPREPQEDAPPLENSWNEELPKNLSAAPRDVPPVEDIWGAPVAPAPASSPAPTPASVPASGPKISTQPKPLPDTAPPESKKPPKASVGKAPWEEEDEDEDEDAGTSFSAADISIPAPQPSFKKPEPAAEPQNKPSNPHPIWDESVEENPESAASATVADPVPAGPKLSIPEHLQKTADEEFEEEAIEEVVETPPPPPPPPPPAPPVHVAPARPEPVLSEVQVALLEVVALHHQWLSTGGKEGHRALITGNQFRGADFSGLYLAEASFRHANLPASRFEGANLERVDFSEANLEAADFSRSVVNHANFQRAQLGQADFTDAQVNEADFTGAELVGAIMIRTQLEWAIFCDALLSEADLRQANLEKANLRSASLFRARLEGANLSQADCRNANFDQANMDDAVLQQTNLQGSQLKGVEMQQADFTQASAVPVEAMEDSLAQEREWLTQEAARLEKLKLSLEYREQQLEEAQLGQPEAFAQAAPAPRYEAPRVTSAAAIDTSYLQQLLSKNGKFFMKLGIVWLVTTLLVLSISLSAFEVMDSSQLNFIELLLFAFIFFAPPGLCMMSMVKSNKLARTLEQLSGEGTEES